MSGLTFNHEELNPSKLAIAQAEAGKWATRDLPPEEAGNVSMTVSVEALRALIVSVVNKLSEVGVLRASDKSRELIVARADAEASRFELIDPTTVGLTRSDVKALVDSIFTDAYSSGVINHDYGGGPEDFASELTQTGAEE